MWQMVSLLDGISRTVWGQLMESTLPLDLHLELVLTTKITKAIAALSYWPYAMQILISYT